MTINKIIYSILLLGCFTLQAQVKVGNNPATINATAAFEVESITKGFLPPRMTTGERDLIASPAKGLVLYNTSLDCLQINKGTAASPNWECIGASAAGTLVANCPSSRFAKSTAPIQDPLCMGLFIGETGYQVKFVIENNSFVAINNVDFSSAVTLSGAGAAGLTVTAGQNNNVSFPAGGPVTLTYNLAGSPTTAGTVTATFSRLGLTCTITNSVANQATFAGNGLDGTTAANANYSCLTIKNAFPASADGVYWIDIDGTCSTNAPMQAQCDMTTDGGGWTLVMNVVATGTTNGTLSRSSFPLIGSNTVGANERGNATFYGISPFAPKASQTRIFVSNGTEVFHVKLNANAYTNSLDSSTGSTLPGHNYSAFWTSGYLDVRFNTTLGNALHCGGPGCAGHCTSGAVLGTFNDGLMWAGEDNRGVKISARNPPNTNSCNQLWENTVHRVWVK